ncbi:MAG TPA: hypothetical protein VEU29_05485 [Actinomycetota bacterium]|nr:hypothetical protein [Actinomycetota bacterium]
MTAPAKYLTAHFEGHFMCRLAVDPDPTNETRGRSGYTMALPHEDPLDQVIRLQPDAYVERNTRAPADELGIRIGVDVTAVTFDGKPWEGAPNLLGAHVSLQGREEGFDGAVFVSRNNVIGSDDTMAFVIDPFELQIEGPGGVRIRAIDHVDPSDPTRPLWRIANPAIYDRRLPVSFDPSSLEVMQALSVFDGYAYFRGRRSFLQDEIERQRAIGGEEAELAVQEAESRLYQLEFWGDRMINKLGFRLAWEFDVNGPQTAEGDLGGAAATDQPWHVRFWFGGWDGDLLTGYMRGDLSIPFAPARR